MKEPAYTCPQIDKVKECIRSAFVEADYAKDKLDEMTIESIRKTFREIYHHLDGVADMMESIRGANADIRDWGTEHRERMIDLEDEIYHLREELENN